MKKNLRSINKIVVLNILCFYINSSCCCSVIITFFNALSLFSWVYIAPLLMYYATVGKIAIGWPHLLYTDGVKPIYQTPGTLSNPSKSMQCHYTSFRFCPLYTSLSIQIVNVLHNRRLIGNRGKSNDFKWFFGKTVRNANLEK